MGRITRLILSAFFIVFLPLDMASQSKNLQEMEDMADSQCRKGQWEVASKSYQKLIEFDPNTARYHYKLGGVIGKMAQEANVFKAMSLVDDAKKSLSRALVLRPDYLEVFWAQTELYTQLPGILGGGKSTALTYAQKIANLNLAIGSLARSRVFHYYKDYDQRNKANATALSLPTNWCSGQNCTHSNEVHFAYGQAAFQNKREQEQGILFLKRYCNDFSAVDQQSIEQAYYLIAHLSFQKEDFAQAKTYINLALSKQPKWKDALLLKQQIDSK